MSDRLLARILGLGAGSVLLAGCATAFTGDAHVPGGAAGCKAACAAHGMDLAGMVIMGEYSDGCVCKVRGSGESSTDAELGVAGASPAAVSVVSAMRARQQAQQAPTP